jgi:dihydropteroate synthase
MRYHRPISLVFGPDATRAISNGTAGALGGMAHIGFTQVEIIERGLGKTIAPFAELSNTPAIQNITRLRPSFGGIALDQCQIMGIMNVTPDSFSDGGKNFAAETAIAQGRAMADQGATILDIGGESTRPGSDAVSIEEERARIIPVITELAKTHTISVDTRKAVLMQDALKHGAKIINDVSALGYDAQSATTVAQAQAPVILMHAQGEPRTMQLQPKYDDVALDVYDQLAALVAKAEAAGIPKSRICIDPGIGLLACHAKALLAHSQAKKLLPNASQVPLRAHYKPQCKAPIYFAFTMFKKQPMHWPFSMQHWIRVQQLFKFVD